MSSRRSFVENKGWLRKRLFSINLHVISLWSVSFFVFLKMRVLPPNSWVINFAPQDLGKWEEIT